MSSPRLLQLLRAPELGLAIRHTPVDQEGKPLLENLALRDLPDKHRVVREDAFERHERAGSVGELLGPRCEERGLLLLALVGQCLAFLRLDLVARDRANLGVLRQALLAKVVHCLPSLQILPSVFQMEEPESPWLNPKSEAA